MRVYWLCPTVRLNDGGRYPAPTSHIGAQHSESTSVTTKPCRCVWFLAPHMVSHMISRCPHDQNGPCVPPPVKRHSAGGPRSGQGARAGLPARAAPPLHGHRGPVSAPHAPIRVNTTPSQGTAVTCPVQGNRVKTHP